MQWNHDFVHIKNIFGLFFIRFGFYKYFHLEHNSKLFSNLNFLPNQTTILSKNHEFFRLVLLIRTPLIIKEVEFGEIWPK